MKIHNLGNDYAFQQKQKSEQKKRQVIEPETKPEPDVTDKIQTGGEGNMAVSPQEGKEAVKQEIPSPKKQKAQREEKKAADKAKVSNDSKIQ